MLSSSACSAFRLSFSTGLEANVIFSRAVACENVISHRADDNREITHKLGLQGIDLVLESVLLRVISILVGPP